MFSFWKTSSKASISVNDSKHSHESWYDSFVIMYCRIISICILQLFAVVLVHSFKSNVCHLSVGETGQVPSSLLRCKSICIIRGGFGGGSIVTSSNDDDDHDELTSSNIDDSDNLDTVTISGTSSSLDGIYMRTKLKMNGRSHYERPIKSSDINGDKLNFYWTGSQWVIHYDLNPSLNFNNLLAYSKAKFIDPTATSNTWYVRTDKTFKQEPSLSISSPTRVRKGASMVGSNRIQKEELLGVPSELLPLYISFMFDAVATGLAMPLLPFYVMELGANALQLSLVISSNYVAQMVGCLVMGRVSDKYGRRVVLLSCLGASSLSYACVSRATSLKEVAFSRIICGIFGGLVPVMQSCVADVASQGDRPKYLGRVMATFGLGFVLGPALSASLPFLSTRQKVRVAALLPLLGFLVSLFFFKETKKSISAASSIISVNRSKGKQMPSSSVPVVEKRSDSVLLLVLNGFLIMYAFATETIYAIFIKDSFGYGERALSTLFAVNGVFIGIFQVFLIKPLVNLVGKHVTLIIGNFLLAIGMVGVALVRRESFHFLLFAVHIVGYSIADTALASLISRYSPESSQGRDLALNQAAQACGRVLSPLIAGLLYERSKRSKTLPLGALPFLAGSIFPAAAICIPSLLYIRSVRRKKSGQDIVK